MTRENVTIMEPFMKTPALSTLLAVVMLAEVAVADSVNFDNAPVGQAPAGALPDYDSASIAEREFLHVGKPGFPVPNFDDGSAAYEVI